MRRVLFFMLVSANGYYERAPWAIDWHMVDAEFNTFAEEQLDSVDTILFGRKTYEGMASYWPTPEAIAADLGTARRMSEKAKVVFSKTLPRAEWNNTHLVKGDAAAEVRRLKDEPGKDIAIFGSSDLTASGKPLFAGLTQDLALRLVGTRTFGNGNVLLRYVPG
jgi:dihydrofolate reductase